MADPLQPLATRAQLTDWLQVTELPPGPADLALRIASGLVRAEARCTFARRTDTATLGIIDGAVELPGPVVSVDSVTASGDVLEPGDWTLEGDRLTLPAGVLLTRPGRVTVTWTHGYAAVPVEVEGIVLDVAGRCLSNPRNLRQEATGQRSLTFAAETIGASLSPMEKDRLFRFRPSSRNPMGRVT